MPARQWTRTVLPSPSCRGNLVGRLLQLLGTRRRVVLHRDVFVRDVQPAEPFAWKRRLSKRNDGVHAVFASHLIWPAEDGSPEAAQASLDDPAEVSGSVGDGSSNATIDCSSSTQWRSSPGLADRRSGASPDINKKSETMCEGSGTALRSSLRVCRAPVAPDVQLPFLLRGVVSELGRRSLSRLL